MSERLEEARKKLRFADYLLTKESADVYARSATEHILRAANLAVSELFDLGEKNNVSPAIVQKRLEGGSQQEKEFSKYFLELWRLSVRPNVSKKDLVDAYNKVKTFIEWVKNRQTEKICQE